MRSAIFTALIIATALFMENMDGTVISTSLPAIAADLHKDPIVLKLALTSYMLTLAVFIPASGWVADRFGARTVFCTAIIVFTLGSILCGASSSLPTLIAGSSLFIHTIRMWGPWSPIHLLSLFTLAVVPIAVWRARQHDVRSHRQAMIWIYALALVVTGLFTLAPGRIMNKVVFGG